MACTKKTECQKWLRKGDLACRKCPQDPPPPEEPAFAGDDEDNEGVDEESVESMLDALDDARDAIGVVLGRLNTAALHACGPAKGAIGMAVSLILEAKEIVARELAAPYPRPHPNE